MHKEIKKENVYYNITWSRHDIYTRHSVMGIPAMAGIVCVFRKKHDIINYLLFYASWKGGVRSGARDLLDPDHSQFPELITLSDNKDLMFKYAIIDTSPLDMQDIMYWLINEYKPELNNSEDFIDSQRYKEIYLLEYCENNEDEGSSFPKRTKK